MGNYLGLSSSPIEPKRFYGWKRDQPDHRDLKKTFTQHELNQTPDNVDLRPNCPPIYDQGQLGSCTANGGAAAYQYDEIKQHNSSQFIPSRLYLYYNTRAIEGTIDQDSGAQIRNMIKSMSDKGMCREDQCPYDITKFTQQPSQECYDFGKDHKPLKYERVLQDQSHIEACLNQQLPIIFGFEVYESFESEEVAKTGQVPLPGPNEKLVGGHCTDIVGYDRQSRKFIVRNSWGPNWGDGGYCYFPYEYILNTNLCADFWVVQTISNN